MSDMVDVINRLESWIRNYGHEKQPEFIADLRALIATAKASQRAVELLEKLDRYNVDRCAIMEWCRQGDWVDFGSVSAAIQILKGECKE